MAKKSANAGNRNDTRSNGKAAKKNPGRTVKGSRGGEKLDQGFLLLLGKGPLTRKESIYRGPSPANAAKGGAKPQRREGEA